MTTKNLIMTVINIDKFLLIIILFSSVISCKGQKINPQDYNGIYQTGETGTSFYLKSDSTQVFNVIRKDAIHINQFESSELVFQNSIPMLAITLTAVGKEKLDSLTLKNIKKPLPIIFNNKLYSAPLVQERIQGGRLIISGFKNLEEVTKIQKLIAD